MKFAPGWQCLPLLLTSLLLLVHSSIADDVIGCGGFIKASRVLDFSKINVQLYSKAGSRVSGNLRPNAYEPEVMAKLRRMVAGSQMYLNHGANKFEPVGKAVDVVSVGWAYGPTLADLDNDGFLDIYAPTGFISRTRDKPDG